MECDNSIIPPPPSKMNVISLTYGVTDIYLSGVSKTQNLIIFNDCLSNSLYKREYINNLHSEYIPSAILFYFLCTALDCRAFSRERAFVVCISICIIAQNKTCVSLLSPGFKIIESIHCSLFDTFVEYHFEKQSLYSILMQVLPFFRYWIFYVVWYFKMQWIIHERRRISAFSSFKSYTISRLYSNRVRYSNSEQIRCCALL